MPGFKILWVQALGCGLSVNSSNVCMIGLLRDWLLDPAALLFLLSLALGMVLIKRRDSAPRSRSRYRRMRSAGGWKVVMFLWVSAYLLCTAPFVVNPLLATLEDPYSGAEDCPVGSHIVVLGGGVDSRVSNTGQFEYMSNATMARAAAAVRLGIAEPDTTIVVAGGALQQISEAAVMSAYLNTLGIDSQRIIQEGGSVNTRENALNVAQLLENAEIRGPVRLVTSAMHMSRASKSFRQVLDDKNIEICPVAVDFQALKNLPAWSWMPQTTTIVRFDKWFHEVIALLWYRHNGWI